MQHTCTHTLLFKEAIHVELCKCVWVRERERERKGAREKLTVDSTPTLIHTVVEILLFCDDHKVCVLLKMQQDGWIWVLDIWRHTLCCAICRAMTRCQLGVKIAKWPITFVIQGGTKRQVPLQAHFVHILGRQDMGFCESCFGCLNKYISLHMGNMWYLNTTRTLTD